MWTENPRNKEGKKLQGQKQECMEKDRTWSRGTEKELELQLQDRKKNLALWGKGLGKG